MLKSRVYELERSYNVSSYRLSEQDSTIATYQCVIEQLNSKIVENEIRVPALKASNKSLEDALDKKDKECIALEQQLRNIENRWRSNAKDPHRLTAKSMLSVLKLKSLNEQAQQTVRKGRFLANYRRDQDHKETITEICGIRFEMAGRAPFNDKETITEDFRVDASTDPLVK